MQEQMKKIPHVVIIGSGFGGLRAAHALAKAPVQVTLLDKNNYHLFQPLLYQVATSVLSADSIAYPIRSIFRDQKNLRFHMSTVREIDLEHKRVVNDSISIDYDYLVIAVGGVTNFFGIDSAKRYGFGLKSLSDAVDIRNHLLSMFERAAKESDPVKRQALLTFVIGGGGPTGVETAGAFSELIRLVLSKDFPEINFDEVKIILLEALDSLLRGMPADLSRFAEKVLEQRQVDVRLKAALEDFTGSEVKLKDGTSIPACTLIWAAGVRASPLLDTLGLEQDKLGRVKVGPTLQVPGHPEVFIIGDAASLKDGQEQPLPMVAPVAIQGGEAAAKNIIRLTENKPLLPFEYHDPGTLATIGRSQAVAQIGRWKLKGLIAWLVWVVVHIYQLIGFRNRAIVMTDWAWNYIFQERAVRIIEPG